MNSFSFLTLLLALQLSSTAFANDTGTDRSVSILKEHLVYTVQKDGSYSFVMEGLRQINEERAIASESQLSLSFNKSLETLEMIEAYTEKPDGRKIPVKPEQIKLQQEPSSSGAPMFQDMQVKVVIYPEVQIGDKLFYKYELKRHKAAFYGHFSDVTTPHFRPVTELRMTYDIPEGMPFHFEAIGYSARPTITKEGRTIYQWDYIPAENSRIESGSVDYINYGRRLLVSTFPDYATLGLAYAKGAENSGKPNQAITDKALELTKGIKDPREKVTALHNWVRRNIRYVAVYIGNGGFIPHNADGVFEARYGDCKDHAALMEAMLIAVGIESTPVLINTNNSFELLNVVIPQFDHAITYIPSLALFLDTTASDIGAGYLPVGSWDKKVILVKTGEIRRTPVSQEWQVQNNYQVKISADGSAHFTFVQKRTGQDGEPTRRAQNNWAKSDRDLAVENILKSQGLKGNGTVELGDTSETGGDYQFKLQGEAENWTYVPGTIGISTSSSLYAGLANAVFGFTSEPKRTQDFVCPVNNYVEKAVYQLPKKSKIVFIPKATKIITDIIQYSADYVHKGQEVIITRSLKSGKATSRVCTPEDHANMQVSIKKMVRDLRTQFLVEVR